jgi:hypothetical protein
MLPTERLDVWLPPDGQNRLERGWKGLGVERKNGKGLKAKLPSSSSLDSEQRKGGRDGFDRGGRRPSRARRRPRGGGGERRLRVTDSRSHLGLGWLVEAD